ncbi:DNA photolyase [Roseibacterium beibuensis]|uniref:Cryptochrome/DNA photolyase FAD-binding domain-containing protein n=1 Tax=[Roseibacterium] beibuensis TaxID=1193142 RepID=A0ABP9KW60_9RHOB|nr:FAD-binding domain-containing protein [Roseibacterium beibuensis]MCS6621918.1 DNA photolyase [Roseibacterium beibuensis]
MTNDAAFTPTRHAALERLSAFLPHAGKDYAAKRNYDLPEQGHPHVSGLSPYLRHRLLTEEEVVEAVLGRFSTSSTEKFIQEVLWHSYWKGWLELRPSVWSEYRNNLDAELSRLSQDPDLAEQVAKAEQGETGIDVFDGWMHELRDTGYLHNHARMWAASIWIFTLRLPWELGADHFLRHLLDGDPASNTLGWRWVAGLQTRGKNYVARASNIEKFTDRPIGSGLDRLARDPAPLDAPPPPSRREPPAGGTPRPGAVTGVLLTEEDLSPRFLLSALREPPVAHAILNSTHQRSPRGVSAPVADFAAGALADARTRWQDKMGAPGPEATDPTVIADWAQALGLDQVVTAYAPTGPAARALSWLDTLLAERGIALVQVLRDWDNAAWPHATHGFFRFKERIPDLIGHLQR